MDEARFELDNSCQPFAQDWHCHSLTRVLNLILTYRKHETYKLNQPGLGQLPMPIQVGPAALISCTEARVILVLLTGQAP